MRFQLNFNLTNNLVPVEYRRTFLSYIKNALKSCNEGKYYESYFKDTSMKDYNFTTILSKCKFTKENIEIGENTIKVIFSTDDRNKTGFILYSAFLSQKGKSFKLAFNNYMTLTSITTLPQEIIVNERIILKTMIGSGICVRDHVKESNKDRYVIFSDNDFREKLNITVRNQLKNANFNEYQIKNFKINPIECKKVVVKHYNQLIDVSIGTFEVAGDVETLQYLYNIGIGSRASSGFGSVELVTQDLI